MSDKDDAIDFSLVLASSVHDMKNSIGMLINSLEAVVEDFPLQEPKQKKRFNTLHYEASRINSELIQLLTIYRMQNEFLPVRIDQHYVIDLLEEQVARNFMLMDTGEISLEMTCDEDLNWYYDSDLIGSVVHNIIVNCARYTQSAISVAAYIEDELLNIVIEDNGPGYPDHMLKNPSVLIDEVNITQGNTHLGLYFAEKIAARHKQHERQGSISLKNGGRLGGGVFKISLP